MAAHRSMKCRCEDPLKRRSNLLLLILSIALIGCTPASPLGTAVPLESALPTERASPVPPSSTATPPLPGLSVEQIRNAQYQPGFTDSPRTVQLADGNFQEGTSGSAEFKDIRVTDYIAMGDIDGDGVNEAAAIVSENYGGSGVFVFLALYIEQAGQPEFVASVFIDDRPAVESIGFEKDEIFMIVTTHGADDPFCCPTLRNERRYRLINNQIELAEYGTYTPEGAPRTIAIESPVNGTEVFNSVQIKGTVSAAPFENNLAYRIYDVGGVELSAGAITVSAAEAGGGGAFNAMIPLGSILSGAAIRIEIQDVNAADGSLLAMDSVELVVK